MPLVRVLALALLTTTLGCAAAPPRAAFGDGKQARAHACHAADECALVPRSCCGQCGQPASGDVRAVLASAVTTPGRCEGVGCPRCHADPDPLLVAYCASGTCRALDLHTSPLTRCSADTDCVVRPRGCCECGATEWIAVRASQSSAYALRVCGPVSTCPECVGRALVAAVCREGHCAMSP